jgi:hypothetical protein
MMTRTDLLRLLSLREQPLRALRTREPRLFEMVVAPRRTAVTERLMAALGGTPAIANAASTFDASTLSPAEVPMRLAATLERAGLSVDALRVARDRIARTVPAPRAETDDVRIADDPDSAPLLDRARLYQLSELAGLPEPVADALTARLGGPQDIDTATLDGLVADNVLSSAAAAALHVSATIYAVVDEDMALAAAIRNGARPTTTRALATMTPAQWTELLRAHAPRQVERAESLARQFAALHPTAALGGRLPRRIDAPNGALLFPGLDLGAVLSEPAEVERRIGAVHDAMARLGDRELVGLDLTDGSVDRQVLGNLGSADDERRVISTLRGYQRLLALGDADDAVALLAADLASATKIASMPLAAMRARTGWDANKAGRTWRLARQLAADAAAAFGGVLDLRYGMFRELRTSNVMPNVEEALRRNEGYDVLFGSLDFCTCGHCDSILGPAAYFVDVMKFVDDNIRAQLGPRVRHPLDLRTRRPDLWTLDLTCEHTDELVPTLDVVNEVLEQFVASATLRERLVADYTAPGFTLGIPIASVVRGPWPVARRPLQLQPGPVDPDAVRDSIYRLLAETTDSFQQPFHLPLARIHAQLDALGSSLGEIRRAVGADRLAIARATLRLSLAEWSLVTTRVTSLDAISGLYDLRFAAAGGGVAPIDAKDLVRAVAIDRDTLTELLAAGAAPGATIVPRKRDDRSVQNDVELVQGLGVAALDRLHRFVRLQRAVTWSVAELARVLAAIGADDLDAETVTAIATLRSLQVELELSVDECAALAGELPSMPAGDSLLDRLFNPSGVTATDRLPKVGTRLVHPAFRATTEVAQDPFLARIVAGLGLDLADLAVLLRKLAPALGFDADATDESRRGFVLTTANLTRLFRHARIARALRLPIRDLVRLMDLAKIASLAELASVQRIVELASALRASGYTLDEANDALVPASDAALAELVTAAQTVPPDEPATSPPAERLAQRLATALGFSRDKLVALARLGGLALDTPALATGDIVAVTELARSLRSLAVMFRAAEWDVAAIDFVREAPARYEFVAGAVTLETLFALGCHQRLARTAGVTPVAERPIAVRDAIAALSGPPSDTAAAAVARVLGTSPGIMLALRGLPLPRAAAHALRFLERATGLAHDLAIDGATLRALSGDDFTPLDHAADALRDALRATASDEPARKARLAPIEDTLRERRRDALVAYLLHSFVDVDPHRRFRDADDLYSYFLVDVSAGGCATTSRVVSAISSVQLFVQRVLMRLEQSPDDATDRVMFRIEAEPAAEWSWRKTYREWEANRKVFLWPENYLEPDLRDDKTSLFEELETELLQTDLTDLDVLDAYTKYLAGFEELATLSVAGAYHDMANGDDVLHLFGVTHHEPPMLYYRICEGLNASARDPMQTALWSPWRKVTAQVGTRLVSPVVHDGRLHLLWSLFRTRPISNLIDGRSVFDHYAHTMSVRLATLRPDGTWTVPQTVELPDALPFGPGKGVIPDGQRITNDDIDGVVLTRNSIIYIHREPIEDYTLAGPSWEWLWLEPVIGPQRSVLRATYRDFQARHELDLFARRMKDPPAANRLLLSPIIVRRTLGDVLIATRLYRPDGPEAGLGYTAAANLRADAARESEFVIDSTDALGGAPRSVDVVHKIIGTLPPHNTTPTTILAVPGSVEDAIVQIGNDVVLVHGSSTRGQLHVVRRLGTTLAPLLARTLFVDGLDGLLATRTQTSAREAEPPLALATTNVLDRIARTIDFSGPFGIYFREIFFHVPFLIATALAARGRFEAAQRWFRYLYDPTADDGLAVPNTTPAEIRRAFYANQAWRYLEFRGLGEERLRDILADGAALAAYRNDPFNPHAIARVRLTAYQKAVFMRYIANLIDWGDHLFTQFTTESVNEALSLYVQASELLGPRPTRLGACGEQVVKPRTYDRIAPVLGVGEPFLIELENIVIGKAVRDSLITADRRADLVRRATGTTSPTTTKLFRPSGKRTPIIGWGPNLGASSTHRGHGAAGGLIGRATVDAASFGSSIAREVGPAFCIPANQELLAYWDRVEDRLYKIRHCRDIDGQLRQPALFAPELDPRLLVRLRAAGLGLEDVLGAAGAEVPAYRFSYLIERAKAFAAGLSSYGAALLSALEKKDAEELTRLRLVHQQNLTRMTTQLRRWEVDVAGAGVDAVNRQIEAATYRQTFHTGLLNQDRTANETAQSAARHSVTALHATQSVAYSTGAAIVALFGQLGSPFALKWGGVELSGSSENLAEVVRSIARGLDAVAASTGLEAGFARRREGWTYQKTLADHDAKQLERQAEAANLRLMLAQRALELHEKSIDQLDEQLELYDGKFTSMGLYTWLSTEIRRLYRSAYQNALAVARLAEQAYRFERGDDAAAVLAATYWDASSLGLLSGERLLADLQVLERRYIETNKRTLEIDQAFALSQIAPEALLQLRETGACEFTIPEVAFDLAYRGHYKRRIRSVRLTIPCVTGPYVNVSAILTLQRSWIRATPTPGAALGEMLAGAGESVAASTAQSDAGVFEVSLRDERYLPFEGAGAISAWRLVLPQNFKPFDYRTMNEVILSISYTAEQDDLLREHVEAEARALEGSILRYLRDHPIPRVLSLRQDFSSAFTHLLHRPTRSPIRFELTRAQFPSLLERREVSIERSMLLLRLAPGAELGPNFAVTVDGTPLGRFQKDDTLGGLLGAELPPAFNASPPTMRKPSPHVITIDDADGLAPIQHPPGDVSAIDADLLQDAFLLLQLRVL